MTEQPASPPGVPQWDIADRISKALRHGGVSTGEMADYLGVSRQTIGNWTHGRFDPSIQSMRLIAMRCGVSYSWLRTGEADAQGDGPTPGPGTTSSFAKGRLDRSLRPRFPAYGSYIPALPLTRVAA